MHVCQQILPMDGTSGSAFSQVSLKCGGKYRALKFGDCAVPMMCGAQFSCSLCCHFCSWIFIADQSWPSLAPALQRCSLCVLVPLHPGPGRGAGAALGSCLRVDCLAPGRHSQAGWELGAGGPGSYRCCVWGAWGRDPAPVCCVAALLPPEQTNRVWSPRYASMQQCCSPDPRWHPMWPYPAVWLVQPDCLSCSRRSRVAGHGVLRSLSWLLEMKAHHGRCLALCVDAWLWP